VAHEYEVPDMAETYTKSDRPRVLIVEDDGDLCEVIKTMAGNEMHFEIAGSVKLAEKRIARQTYDLIILDPGLPDGNSLDLLDQIRESGNSATPLVVYSSDELDHETAGKFDRYLQKAKNNSEDLLSVIRELI
jgi:DNA-binding response OmpR family regulator